MKNVFTLGDKKLHKYIIGTEDLASFDNKNVHPVCSTFCLAREMEWSSRLFVLEMLDEDEEGIGTKLEIKHLSPAVLGEEMVVEAIITKLAEHEIICDISVKVGDRIIASGSTGQKILKKEKIERLISNIHNNGAEEK